MGVTMALRPTKKMSPSASSPLHERQLFVEEPSWLSFGGQFFEKLAFGVCHLSGERILALLS